MGMQLFSKKDVATDDLENYMEVNVSDAVGATKGIGKIGIKIDKLSEFGDTDRVLKHVREGNIIFLRIKGLKDKDIGELKRAVEKLKRTVSAQNGDIIGAEQDWLILTPEFAIVHR